MNKIIFLLLLSMSAQAAMINLHVHDANIRDIIYLLAKKSHHEVSISPHIGGTKSFKISNVEASVAFNNFLNLEHLVITKLNNTEYIAPRAEIMKSMQENRVWEKKQKELTPLKLKFWNIRYIKAGELSKLLQNEKFTLLSKRALIAFDDRTNVLYIKDTVKKLKAAERLIKKFDQPTSAVAIKVRIVSIDIDFERELGISFTNINSDSQAERKLNGFIFNLAKLADNSRLEVKLSALESAGRAELISSPLLYALNQQTASIEAGEEVPYQEMSLSGGTAIVFKKAVLGLKVTPQILPGRQILLQVQINQDRPSNKMVLGMPTISTRQLTSTVISKPAQTMVIGGIVEQNAEDANLEIPIISSLPVVGWIFKQRNKRLSKRELLIFVTPYLL